MKVYSWTAYHIRDVPRQRYIHTFRCIVAAKSKAEVMRLTGCTKAGLFNLGEACNEEDVALALSAPGTVFAQESYHGSSYIPIENPKGRF